MTQVPQGVKISAYIFYAYAVLLLLAMCGILVANLLPLATGGGDTKDIAPLLIGPAVGGCLLIIFAAIYGFIGYSLMRLQKWSRIAAIVVAILALCSFPIGTIMGGIVLYFMFQKEVTAAFA